MEIKANYGIFFASKNNYDLLENWLLNYLDYVPAYINILNLDLGSCESQKIRGKQICQKFNLIFIEARKTEFQDNIYQIFEELKTLKVDNLLYLHQDCFPIDRETFLEINKIPQIIKVSNFGLIGFNIYHDIEISRLNNNVNEYMTTSRTLLQKGNGYYMKYPKGSRVNYNSFIKKKPFVVENIMWTALFLNNESFNSKIEIDLNFNFFLAADDLVYQFLKCRFKHDQQIKIKFSLPKDSPIGNEADVVERYGRADHVHIWKQKWGFAFDVLKAKTFYNNRFVKKIFLLLAPKYFSNLETAARKSFKDNNIDIPLLKLFYNHDPINGPLKYLDEISFDENRGKLKQPNI